MLEGWDEDKVSRRDISHFHCNAIHPILDVETKKNSIRNHNSIRTRETSVASKM